ncbi:MULTISPECIES: threonine synthase [unclassified Aurantimonas]|uniref:threonine synthase n=1 Tax=unclassified Aurantimonas TaxID=2638230 RepID=UPI002E196102|nr:MULTISPECIES: threonine synthase [unclassified Aurantimonas]MEC5292797.1 threonine synthase [Aurantimonas sp. C2-3-R2]MEC5413849.1 threonine synthase [Aurantimonas sp. C2-4-R8]
MSALSNLRYVGDDTIISAAQPTNNTRRSGELLVAQYDLAQVAATTDRDQIARGPTSLWRYAALLPLDDPENAVTLDEGWTPLIPAIRLGNTLGLEQLFIKDEGRNPSGTFKDRGASVAISRARELGIRTVIHNSSGNAGGAWGLYAARAGLRCINILPHDVLPASCLQSVLSGAVTVQLNDRWQRAGPLVQETAARNGWFNVGTLREPYRLEGKKTMGLELCEQLGWIMPDVIVYPAGGGLGVIAIYKAFDELEELGWIKKGRRPRLVITQYRGCAPIVRAFRERATEVEEWDDIDVLPGGLKSSNPGGGRAVLQLVRETGGICVDISTQEALDAAAEIAATEGVFACPESATTLVGLRKAMDVLPILPSNKVVLMSTGSGLKSIPNFPTPTPIVLQPGEELHL